MIFVTVGTHEQQFNRLIKCVDSLKADGTINEEVIIQTGFSTFKPNYCKWQKLFSYQDMLRNMEEARIVITHGGPSSFIMALQAGKTPIVVPRKKEFDEHVNDHQLLFCIEVAKRSRSIIIVEDIDKLGNTILNFDETVKDMTDDFKSNNILFCVKLEQIVKGMFK